MNSPGILADPFALCGCVRVLQVGDTLVADLEIARDTAEVDLDIDAIFSEVPLACVRCCSLPPFLLLIALLCHLYIPGYRLAWTTL